MSAWFVAGLITLTSGSAGALANQSETYTVSSEWGIEPLGGVIAVEEVGPAVIKQELKSRYKRFPVSGDPLVLFKDNQPQALIVIPAAPNSAERQAAALLQEIFGKITNTDFIVAGESEITRVEEDTGDRWVLDGDGKKWQYVIWVGNTEAAQQHGLDVSDLLPEGYRTKSDRNYLYLKGNDITKSGKQVLGTYYAAVALLENYLGVRWLWPGELGTVIPQLGYVELPALFEQDEAVLEQRDIRSGTGINDRAEAGLKLLGGTEKEYAHYREFLRKRREWYVHQRCGARVNLQYRHAYGHWYEKYGEEHPEWFALQPSGSRVQTTDRPRLCKSNPEVAKQKAREVIEMFKKNPKLDTVSISPNDGSGGDHFCMCVECRKLDPENGPIGNRMFSLNKKRFYQQYPSFSDRVVTFYNRIAEEVVKELPDARLGAYAYSSYREAPLGVSLHPSIVIGFVGLDYFNEETRQVDLKRWDAWTHKAHSLFLRPNAILRMDGLPAIYVTRLAEDIRHCYQTGMTVADFDSLSGHWSTVGLNYYVLAKLLWDPAADEQAIVRDYCEKGFGKAADKMQEYFRLMEEATLRVAQRRTSGVEGDLRAEEQDRPAENAAPDREQQEQNQRDFYLSVFSPEFVGHLRGVLKEAEALAEDETIRERVRFFGYGLDYVDLFRQAVNSKRASAEKQALLDWFRKTYYEAPEAIGMPVLLWKLGATFRGLK